MTTSDSDRTKPSRETLQTGVGNPGTPIIIKMTPEMEAMLDEARAAWDRLKEAGTPYWCIHEGREVTSPWAYWKEDGYMRADGLKMQYKHGVMCHECGGYIQEG